MLNWQTSPDLCSRRVIEEHPGNRASRPLEWGRAVRSWDVRVALPAKQRIRQPFPSEEEAVEDAQVEDCDNNVCVPPAGLRQWRQPL
jgi:hypothetical protein